MELEVAKCSSCGAAVRITARESVTTCSRCGSSLLIPTVHAPHTGGPAPANLMRLAQAALAGGNADEAYAYFTRVLESEPDNVDAWLGKAEAAGTSGSLKNPRFEEVVAAIDQAIAAAPASEQGEVRSLGTAIVTAVGGAYFRAALEFYHEYSSLDSAWPDLVGHSFEAIGVLDAAYRLGAPDRAVIQQIIEICHSLLSGQQYYAEYDEHPQMRTVHLAPQTVPRVRQILAEQVGRMRLLDPTFNPPPDPIVVAQDLAKRKAAKTATVGGVVAAIAVGAIVLAYAAC